MPCCGFLDFDAVFLDPWCEAGRSAGLSPPSLPSSLPRKTPQLDSGAAEFDAISRSSDRLDHRRPAGGSLAGLMITRERKGFGILRNLGIDLLGALGGFASPQHLVE